MPRQSLSQQQEQEFLTAYRQLDAVHQRLFAGLVELLARDGVAGWVRFRTFLNRGIRIMSKKGKR
jgi:hypothetical protein